MESLITCYPQIHCGHCGADHYNLTGEEEDNLWSISDGGNLNAEIIPILHDNSVRKRCLFDVINRNNASLEERLEKKVEAFTILEKRCLELQKHHTDLKAHYDELKKAVIERVAAHESRIRALCKEKMALEERNRQMEANMAALERVIPGMGRELGGMN
ncbi:uncharacterized protein BDZ99DRAFT_562312 [Mytilinidion resinicola]|uniref:Uncharacterized protein n=1 Tax=Mytilinidion resinicola TaxID=574789 RepID=A0A6A6YRQ5_9PEZI|nr:uncharacterized protein BDZ99DRAFT_562312 [Mytilinidion resinicola]KAF2811238.1 hypothetical protein BDZ99DRAFT_562312 [Mytilinidion resinicola]